MSMSINDGIGTTKVSRLGLLARGAIVAIGAFVSGLKRADAQTCPPGKYNGHQYFTYATDIDNTAALECWDGSNFDAIPFDFGAGAYSMSINYGDYTSAVVAVCINYDSTMCNMWTC